MPINLRLAGRRRIHIIPQLSSGWEKWVWDMGEVQAPTPEMSAKQRVLIVDDHSSVRFALKFVINGAPDLVVCGETEDAQPALALVEKLSPHIIVVDVALKRSHGLDLINDLHIRFPKLPILVYSAHNEALYAPLCFQFGARGYVNKGEDVQSIVHAIRTVLGGEVHLSPAMFQWFTSCALDAESIEPRHPLGRLSPRELQVFEMLGRGVDVKEIASRLGIGQKTIEIHRQHIKEKLGARSAPEVLQVATLWCNSPASEN